MEPATRTNHVVGEEYAMVHLRGKAVIVHLVVDGERGILAGLDPEAALDLTTFVVERLEQVDVATPLARNQIISCRDSRKYSYFPTIRISHWSKSPWLT